VTNHVTPASFTYGDTARFAPLPAIIKAKTKPLTEAPLGALGVDLALKSRYTTYELPAARKAGVKVKDVQELVQRLRTEAKVL
jgi:electron transfer flavoprotein beta subunit